MPRPKKILAQPGTLPQKAISKGKAAPAFPNRDERAASFLASINKNLKGRAVLMPASEYRLPYLTKRLPTGLLTLDAEIGGGFPAGGLSQLIGRRNAGKTMFMWMVIRQLQALLGGKLKVLLAMTEIAADRDQAKKLGVKISMGAENILAMNQARIANGWPPFSDPEMAYLTEEVGDILELHALSAEDFFDTILQAVDENVYHLIVIDSIGNILSNAEQENSSVHDKTYGGISGANTTFLKKMTNLLTMPTPWGGVRDTCIIGINQVRDNIKDPNKAYKAPGGNALEHTKLLDIYVESGRVLGVESKVYTPEGYKQRFEIYGKEVNWRIEKGKAGIHEGGKGTFVFKHYDIHDDGTKTQYSNVDYFDDSLVAGVKYGVIETAGSYIGIPDGAGGYVVREQGRDNFLDAIRDNSLEMAARGTNEDSFMNLIRDRVFKTLGINISYDNWD